MGDTEDYNTPADEWDTEIIGEEPDRYVVAWTPTLIPKENANVDLIQEWEAKKARIRPREGKAKAVLESRGRELLSRQGKSGQGGISRGKER